MKDNSQKYLAEHSENLNIPATNTLITGHSENCHSLLDYFNITHGMSRSHLHEKGPHWVTIQEVVKVNKDKTKLQSCLQRLSSVNSDMQLYNVQEQVQAIHSCNYSGIHTMHYQHYQ